MKSRTVSALASLFFLSVSCGSTWGQNGAQRLPRSGALTISANSPQGKATVQITTATLENPCATACPVSRAWIDLGGVTSAGAIQAMEISVGDAHLGVPLSVYASLLAPGAATLVFEKGYFVLKVYGGDGGEAYFALIYFTKSEVSKMEIYASESPAHPTQITRYYHVAIG